MAAPDATVQTAIVGGISALLTLVLSKWFDSRAVERRAAAEERRAADRAARRDLRECEQLTDRLRDRTARLEAENASMRAVLIARGIPLPVSPRPSVPQLP